MNPKYKDIGGPVINFVEECSEVIKAACKGERFGWDSYSPYDMYGETNLDCLKAEWEDVNIRYQELLSHIKNSEL
jgi:hypothetical protein